MNDVELTKRLKALSRVANLNPHNYGIADKPKWFEAIAQGFKAKGRALPTELTVLARKYAGMELK